MTDEQESELANHLGEFAPGYCAGMPFLHWIATNRRTDNDVTVCNTYRGGFSDAFTHVYAYRTSHCYADAHAHTDSDAVPDANSQTNADTLSNINTFLDPLSNPCPKREGSFD